MNEALGSYKIASVGVESDWAQGTITSGTELLPLREAGMAIGNGQTIIKPSRIQATAVRKKLILGTLAPKLSMPLFGYPHGNTLDILKAAMGTVVSTEVDSFTIGAGTNDKIDFKEDAGTELTATLTAATYPMGADSSVSGSLCAELKTQLESAGTGTFTVTFTLATKKLTIAVTGSASTVQLLPATGANTATSAGPIIGFVTDSSDSASIIADTAVVEVTDHVFTIAAANTYGLSVGLTTQLKLADGKVFDILDCVVDQLKMTFAPNSEVMWDAEIEGRQVAASGDTLSALTAPTAAPLLYSQLVFTVAGTPHTVTALEWTLNNNLKKDMFINSQYRSKFPRNGFADITGSFTLDLADSRSYSIYDDMIADTQPALVATFTGPTAGIKTGFVHALTVNLYQIQYNLDDVPGGGGAEAPEHVVPFECIDDGSNGALKITVRNEERSI